MILTNSKAPGKINNYAVGCFIKMRTAFRGF